MNKKNKVIIFDFDGVIADSFDTFYLLIKDTMKNLGLSVSKKQYGDMFIENAHKGFKDMINDNKKHKIFKQIRNDNYDKYYKKYYPKIFKDIPHLLKKLDKNYIIAIASSGKKSSIVGLLKKNKLHKHFKMILATNEHSKKNMLEKILKKYKVRPQETIMISDTTGDIKIAKKMGLKTIAVTWGFHNKKLLKSIRPDNIATSVNNLLKLISRTEKSIKNKKH